MQLPIDDNLRTSKQKSLSITVVLNDTHRLFRHGKYSSLDLLLSLFKVVYGNILTPKPVTTLASPWVSLMNPHPADYCGIFFTNTSNQPFWFKGRYDVWLFLRSRSWVSQDRFQVVWILSLKAKQSIKHSYFQQNPSVVITWAVDQSCPQSLKTILTSIPFSFRISMIFSSPTACSIGSAKVSSVVRSATNFNNHARWCWSTQLIFIIVDRKAR